MNRQLPDIFHCQKCGKVVRQSHGQPPPSCCGEIMSFAVSDGLQEPPKIEAAESAPKEMGGGPQNALIQAAAGLASWCRSREKAGPFRNVDGARYAELVWQLQSLRGVLLDRFEEEDRNDGDLTPFAEEGRFSSGGDQLRRQHHDLLYCLDRIIDDFQHRESDCHDWPKVSARIESFEADVRRHEEAKADLIEESLEQDLGTVD